MGLEEVNKQGSLGNIYLELQPVKQFYLKYKINKEDTTLANEFADHLFKVIPKCFCLCTQDVPKEFEGEKQNRGEVIVWDVFEALKNYSKNEIKFEAYVLGIIEHKASDFRNEIKARSDIFGHYNDEVLLTPSKSLSGADVYEKMKQILTPREQIIYVSKRINHFDYDEIAIGLRTTKSSIKRQFYNATNKLKKAGLI